MLNAPSHEVGARESRGGLVDDPLSTQGGDYGFEWVGAAACRRAQGWDAEAGPACRRWARCWLVAGIRGGGDGLVVIRRERLVRNALGESRGLEALEE